MIYDILVKNSQKYGEKLAIESPDCKNISFFELNKKIIEIRKIFCNFGLSKKDRVALIMPNGRATVICGLSILSFGTLAPLNPKYKKQEFEFYLSDLQPKAIIIPKGELSPAISVAEKMGIAVLEIEQANLSFYHQGEKLLPSEKDFSSLAKLEDTALVLHTSGTTSRPKIVPLSQKNLLVSANNTIRTLNLNSEDLCLNVMPFFHIHGLVVSLATLMSGGTLIYPISFNVKAFPLWLFDYQVTWYTAAPTIHQAVVKEFKNSSFEVSQINLKKIRSSSSPLSKELIYELEEIFAAPVIESYGMTEAALQITSNQLPPEKRKAGSAGRADGPELKIVNEDGEAVSIGEIGEVLIKGDNVISAYENNELATQDSFSDGWFRTGDLGYLDEDNYLFITGRVKEMINKGGEKISPREIDEIIMQHPAVYQAVAFAVPHISLGEEVGVAIVLNKEHNLSKEDVQKFVKLYLADFKVPQLIFFLSDIPKGPTGKFQRIGLYEKLKKIKDMGNNNHSITISEQENQFLEIWREVLEMPEISTLDNFFELGGDSLRAKELVEKLKKMDYKIEVEDIFNCPTIKSLVSYINSN
jgi:acyl-CoA synthetase (AMP-forming)/AMP-acid ligase II/acyl carrier protein